MLAETACLVFGVIIFIPILILIMGLRVVKEFERGVILRLGKFIRVQKPGLFYLVPILDQMIKVDLRVKTVDVPKQDAITSDNVPVMVNAVIYYRISDPKLSILKVEHYQIAMAQAAQTTMRTVIGQATLDTLLQKKDMVNNKLKKIIDEVSDPWGIKVESVETKEVILPTSMQRAMAKEAEAERERRARLIKADGELAATKKLMKAGAMLRQEPTLLELRRMQMITEVGAEKNSTTILFIPSEFVSAAGAFQQWIQSKPSHVSDENDKAGK